MIPCKRYFSLMLLSKYHRETTVPEPSSASWHPCYRVMAGVVNNPLHFRGELSALKGCEWKNIKEKHSASVQKSGPRQGIWARAPSCLAHAGKGDPLLSVLGSFVAGAKWWNLEGAQPGGAGPTGRCSQRLWRSRKAVSVPCPWQQADPLPSS